MLKSHPANIIFFYENTIIINFNFFLLIFFLDPDLFSKVSLSHILLEEFLKNFHVQLLPLLRLLPLPLLPPPRRRRRKRRSPRRRMTTWDSASSTREQSSWFSWLRTSLPMPLKNLSKGTQGLLFSGL